MWKSDGQFRDYVKMKLVTDKVEPKPVFVLDENRTRALEKMHKINKIICQLPGIDCGGCGAPNCHALAEDMVQGKAKMTDCIFLREKYLRLDRIKPDRADKNLEKIWGKKRIEADCNKKGGRNEGF
jgi:ArsR family metal-binding transcriptional regulator